MVEQKLIGSGVEVDLAHMNLKDEYLPYKKVIGQIILDVSHPSSRHDPLAIRRQM